MLLLTCYLHHSMHTFLNLVLIMIWRIAKTSFYRLDRSEFWRKKKKKSQNDPFYSERGVLDKTLCDKVCQWLVAGQWFSPSTSVSSTNKTDITEILYNNPNPLFCLSYLSCIFSVYIILLYFTVSYFVHFYCNILFPSAIVSYKMVICILKWWNTELQRIRCGL
jgi:hypothetical protein